jgi:hypothetical protein
MLYDHAFCAKLCQDSQVYVVRTSQNGVRLPDNALDHVRVPGIEVKGRVIEADGLWALAVEKLEPQVSTPNQKLIRSLLENPSLDLLN